VLFALIGAVLLSMDRDLPSKRKMNEDMGVTTEKYVRKPLYVDAVRVTAQNFDDIAAWCEGEVLTEEIPGRGMTKKYIKVAVENAKYDWQKKAFIGDWLLCTERDGKPSYKVYKSKAFQAAFDFVGPMPVGGRVGSQCEKHVCRQRRSGDNLWW
jgi:hypothetical protein